MSLVLTVLLAQAAPAIGSDQPDIVVRARRSGEALAKCIAEKCPTPDDARFAIAHAEAQFAQGNYYDARRTLAAAIGRQRGNAARFPRVVSALYEAAATVNLHYGDMDTYRTMTIGQNRTLSKNLPANDSQVLVMQLQLGNVWLQFGQPGMARAQFENAAEGFESIGEHRLAALSTLRAAMIDLGGRNLDRAERRLRAVAASPAATDVTVQQFSAIVAARLGAYHGDEGAIDRLLTTLRTQPEQPLLLVKDAVVVLPDDRRRQQLAKFDVVNLLPTWETTTPTMQWVDIGFIVAPDGTTGDVEILRGTRSRGWAAPYADAIAKRRYAPIALPAGSPGIYRVERHTYRANRVTPTGSFVKRPVGAASVEILDITKEHVPPPATT